MLARNLVVESHRLIRLPGDCREQDSWLPGACHHTFETRRYLHTSGEPHRRNDGHGVGGSPIASGATAAAGTVTLHNQPPAVPLRRHGRPPRRPETSSTTNPSRAIAVTYTDHAYPLAGVRCVAWAGILAVPEASVGGSVRSLAARRGSWTLAEKRSALAAWICSEGASLKGGGRWGDVMATTAP